MIDTGVNIVTDTARARVSAWLKAQLQAKGYYTPAEDSYALAAFSRFCEEQGEKIDVVSLNRYLTGKSLPTSDRCRSLANVLGVKPVEVLKLAGYLQESDF